MLQFQDSIRNRLTAAFIGLAIGPLIIVGILLGWRSYTQQKDHAFRLQQQVARSVSAEIATFFREIEGELDTMVQVQSIDSLTESQLDSILSQLPVINKAFESIHLLDRNGLERLHISRIGITAVEPEGDWSTNPVFTVAAATGDTYYSPISFEASASEPLMSISRPLLDVQTGSVQGVLIADIRIKPVWELIAGLRTEPGENIFLIDDRGRVVAHRNPSVVLRNTGYQAHESAAIQTGLSGQPVVYAVDWFNLEGQRLGVVAEKPVPQALQLAIDTVLVTVLLVALSLLAAIGLRAMVIQRIIMPLETLADTALAVKQGNLSRQAAVASQDEIGALAATFNSMTGQIRESLEGMQQHVDELEQAKEALRQSEQKYRQLFENAGDIVYTFDMDGNLTAVNSAVAQITGYTVAEIMESGFMALIHPDDRRVVTELMAQKLTGEYLAPYEIRIIHKDGRTLTLELNSTALMDDGRLIGIQGIARDVTQRREAEQSLRQAQKLESLGLLAGGIAHDFNNLLTGILAQASLALSKLPQDNDGREHLQKVVKAAERASDLTYQLLAYAGKGQFQVDVLDLNQVINSYLGLLETAVPKHIQLQLELSHHLPGIEADRGQIQQLVINLIINAAEAIEKDHGRITIRTYSRVLDETDDEQFWGGDTLPQNAYVCLEVEDNGIGMDEVTMAQIFDPFYSTKTEGRGLGLSATLGIIRAHQGGLQLVSKPGQGTRFVLYFPASPFSPAGVEQAVTAVPTQSGGLVLVIDDEESVREAVTDILDMAGVQVLTAENGRVGLDAYTARQSEIDLVLLDMQMPVMNGEETFRALIAFDPTVKVLLSSGYTENEVTSQFAGMPFSGFLQKPYNFDTLVEKVQTALAMNHVGSQAKGKTGF
ncbi:MAG: PAS domain S-box protein [Anaerolineae bacterium]